MNKLKMHTKNKVDVNIEVIGKLFPNTITETVKDYDEKGNPIVTKAIDFDILKQELSKLIVEGKEERYQMNWPGKKEAILRANSPINKTLRPCREESVDFDTTENLYIEGDNLEVLKLLQETYLEKIKMIYIDPPYNTGNDSFVYDDGFAMSPNEFSSLSNQYDEDGNLLFDIRKNNEAKGRIHTDWLNMMYPRLKLAKDILTDDGVIFISIDDNEIMNLRKVCDEVLGPENYICEFIWRSKLGKVGTTNTISITHEYILCYGKNACLVNFKKIENETEGRKENLRQWGQADRRQDRPSMYYPITIDGIEVYPIKEDGSEGRWRVGKDMAQQLLTNGVLELVNKNGIYNIYRNFNKGLSIIPYDTLLIDGFGTTANGSVMLKQLDLGKIFDYAKPINLIMHFIKLCNDEESIVLDFFSGSSTTAHAVMQLNAEDGGKRKFIMVQLQEETGENSEAFKAGYKNICEIGKERIRRAGKKIKEEKPECDNSLDTGFRTLKLDSTNMKDVYYNPVEYIQMKLGEVENNIKEDRSGEDLLFQVMLELGELLSSDIKKLNIEGNTVFNVGDGDIVACFDEKVTNTVITEIAKMQPLYAIFRDYSLSSDSVVTNFDEIFKTYSPNTVRKVL